MNNDARKNENPELTKLTQKKTDLEEVDKNEAGISEILVRKFFLLLLFLSVL